MDDEDRTLRYMKHKISISKELALPLEIVTQTIAIVAKRRSGKSYLARKFAEQLHKAGQQLVIVDPKGDQWGIKSSADGHGPGLPIVIVGGERGDVPLEPSGGEVVAKLIVEERVSALLDLSFLRKHEVATFMTAFLETMYRLKAREQYRTPVMVVIDEADAIAPQQPAPNEARMLGAVEDLVRRGGQRGIGCCLVTQRTAVLNKNVLTQAQILVALRTIAPQDLKAMNAWIDVHGEPEQRKTLMESLPALPIGDAWVWSPGWPTTDGIFQRIHTATIETFDSGATPRPGEKRREPKGVADVDLDAVRRQMAATIERAKLEDPKELRRELMRQAKRIDELQRELKQSRKVQPPAVVKKVEVDCVPEVAMRKLSELLEKAKEQNLIERIEGVISSGLRVNEAAERLRRDDVQRVSKQAVPTKTNSTTTGTYTIAAVPSNGHAGEVGRGGLQRILVALAQCPAGLTYSQIGVRATLSSKSGTFATYMSTARKNDWVTTNVNGRQQITQMGLEALGSYEPLPTGRALLLHWINVLGSGGASRLLTVLAEVHPKSLPRELAAERANLAPSSGTFATYLSKLRKLELISGSAELSASEDLFD